MTKILDELEENFAQLETKVASAGAELTWTTLVEPLEKLNDPLEQTWGVVNHLKAVQDSEELRNAHAKIQPRVVELTQKMSSSKIIYGGYKQLRDGAAWGAFEKWQQRAIERAVKEAELSGVGLEGTAKTRFVEIQSRLSELSTNFSNNVLDSTKSFKKLLTNKADVEGLPATSRDLAASTAKANGHDNASADDGPWMFTLDYPSYIGVMQHAKKRSLREEVYRARIQIASSGEQDNTPIIGEILKLRKERASLLGYANHGEVSLAEKMATLDDANSFLEDLRARSFSAAERDQEEVQALADQHGDNVGKLQHWDISFWAERLRESKFDLKDEELRPYFPLPSVIKGLFGLAKFLFDITIKPVEGSFEKWNKDVQYFEIFNSESIPIASFYLDPYSRPEEKRGGAWMSGVVDRSSTLARPGAKVRLPVAHMVCNGTPPTDKKPSLMTHREVETLFHEFGHALQHMLTTQDSTLVSGINGIEWDAVELPSQFMENWCYHEKTVMNLAKHYETGEPLPKAMFDKLVAARTFRAGTAMLRQLHFAMTDLALHTTYDPSGSDSIYDLEKKVSEKTCIIPPLDENRFLCGFRHIFAGGYSAGYYSYKWAEVLSADAFGAFEEVGLEDEVKVKEMGKRFKDTVLSLGGGLEPAKVFEQFRNRGPTTDALLRHNGLLQG